MFLLKMPRFIVIKKIKPHAKEPARWLEADSGSVINGGPGGFITGRLTLDSL